MSFIQLVATLPLLLPYASALLSPGFKVLVDRPGTYMPMLEFEMAITFGKHHHQKPEGVFMEDDGFLNNDRAWQGEKTYWDRDQVGKECKEALKQCPLVLSDSKWLNTLADDVQECQSSMFRICPAQAKQTSKTAEALSDALKHFGPAVEEFAAHAEVQLQVPQHCLTKSKSCRNNELHMAIADPKARLPLFKRMAEVKKLATNLALCKSESTRVTTKVAQMMAKHMYRVTLTSMQGALRWLRFSDKLSLEDHDAASLALSQAITEGQYTKELESKRSALAKTKSHNLDRVKCTDQEELLGAVQDHLKDQITHFAALKAEEAGVRACLAMKSGPKCLHLVAAINGGNRLAECALEPESPGGVRLLSAMLPAVEAELEAEDPDTYHGLDVILKYGNSGDALVPINMKRLAKSALKAAQSVECTSEL